MGMTAAQQRTAADRQLVQAWKEEPRGESARIADLITAATGMRHAVLLVSGTDEAYADVIPELVLEDVLRVHSYGWPDGFRIELLNPTN